MHRHGKMRGPQNKPYCQTPNWGVGVDLAFALKKIAKVISKNPFCQAQF